MHLFNNIRFYLPLIGALATPVVAADNAAYLLQKNLSSNEGNSLSIDQSAADGSLIRGLVPEAPALQVGSGNSGDVTMTGPDGMLAFQQIAPSPLFRGNSATALVEDGGLGAISQFGNLNQGTLEVGAGASGTLSQVGFANTGLVSVETGGTGVLNQIGHGNNHTLEVGESATASYTVIGNNGRFEKSVSVTSPVPVVIIMRY